MQLLQISNNSSEMCIFLIILDEFLLSSVREMNQRDDITCRVARERVYILMEMFKAMTGLNIVAVHYKGATPALEDVMAGHIQLMFISTGSAMPQAKADTVKIIGLGAEKRMALLPDVPAIAETVPGFTAVSWFGLFGPGRLPPEVVAKINAEVRAIFADPKVRQDFLDAQYFESIGGSPGELSDRIRSEEPKWRKLIRDAHITVE